MIVTSAATVGRAARRLRGYKVLAAAMSVASLSVAGPAHVQAADAPPSDDSLSWRGLTVYGTVDIALQYESHGAPFSDFYTPASNNIVQKNSHESVFGVTGSDESQSKVGLRGIEPLVGDWSGVFAVETWFNPQAGQISNSLKSLTVNNGRVAAQQTTNSDGASAGQAFQIAYVGLHSDNFGTLTFGRQHNLMAEAVSTLDPNRAAPAFSLFGASGTYAGTGTTEDKRLDDAAKYAFSYADTVHIAVLYKFNQSDGDAGGSGIQANIGGRYAGFSIEGIYSKIYDAVSATSLTATQVTGLAKLGDTDDTSVSATISDNTTLALLAAYQLVPVPVKIYAGYEHIQYANPVHPLAAGTTGLGGYTLAYVNNTAYPNDKKLSIYWAGVRYSVLPKLDVVAAYYGFNQNAYGTGALSGCSTVAAATCSGIFRAYSLDASYRFTKRFDAYAGALRSSVSNGLANGYLFTNNINPTIGLRFSF